MPRFGEDKNGLTHSQSILHVFYDSDVGNESSLSDAAESPVEPLSVIEESFHIRDVHRTVRKCCQRCCGIIRGSLVGRDDEERSLYSLNARPVYLHTALHIGQLRGCPNKRHKEKILF